MPRVRNIYQNEALFVGPAPASGYSFMDVAGKLGNAGDFNLIFPIHRTQSISYTATPKNFNLQAIGINSLLDRPQIQPPDFNLEFEYLQCGVTNELRLGFYANYTVPVGPRSGEAYFPDNYNVFLLSGFLSDDVSQAAYSELRWPLQYRDRRNFYIATEREGYDVNLPGGYDDLHPNAQNFEVAGLGNCYITNYSARASVGDFPRATVNYLFENIKFYASGSGIPNPAIDSKSGNLVQDRIVQIPNFQSGTYTIPVLLPGDITVDIYSAPALTGINAVDDGGTDRGLYDQNNLFENLGLKFSDIKIQNYQLNIALPRHDLKSIGYKLPLDRKPDYPFFYDFSMACIVGDSRTGDFTQFMRQNDDYNIILKLKNPPKSLETGIGIRWDMKRAKLADITYSNKIGDLFKAATLRFRGEISDDLTKGIFMSGTPNIPPKELKSALLQEDGVSYVLQEGGSRILLQWIEVPWY